MKYFRVIIVTNDDTTEEDIKDILSHFDGETEVETTKGKIVVPYTDDVWLVGSPIKEDKSLPN